MKKYISWENYHKQRFSFRCHFNSFWSVNLEKKSNMYFVKQQLTELSKKNEVCKEHTLVLEGFKNIIYWIRPVLVRITNFPSGFHCKAIVRIHMLGRQMFVVWIHYSNLKKFIKTGPFNFKAFHPWPFSTEQMFGTFVTTLPDYTY